LGPYQPNLIKVKAFKERTNATLSCSFGLYFCYEICRILGLLKKLGLCNPSLLGVKALMKEQMQLCLALLAFFFTMKSVEFWASSKNSVPVNQVF